MSHWSGLTWDHPRGYNALAAASRQRAVADGLDIRWDVQPLEGFESAPIADLCARYDLVVLDHPHVGEAVQADCLHPLEDVFDADLIAEIERETIGPCLSSYQYDDRHWALPLDAAAQVTVCRTDLLTTPPPNRWDDVLALQESGVPVAASIAGPHALLSFLSICAALGDPPATTDPAILVGNETGRRAYDILARLARRMPEEARPLNPIGLLELMAREDHVALCPLVFGYVNYSRPSDDRKALGFFDAPHDAASHPKGTLGGTGIGLSRRRAPDEALKRHLLWLMGRQAQCDFLPAHDGQPSRREAWMDARVNAAWGGFYSTTAATLEHAYIRPRHAGYIAFQTEASELLRRGFNDGRSADAVIADLIRLYTDSRASGERRSECPVA